MASLSFFSLEHAARSGGGGRTRRRSAPFLSSPRQSDGGRCQCPVRGIQGQDGSHVYGRPYRTAWRCTDALHARCRVSCLLSLSVCLLEKKNRRLGCPVAPTPLAASSFTATGSSIVVVAFVALCASAAKKAGNRRGCWESYAQHVLLPPASSLSGLACTSAHASRYSLRKPRGSLGDRMEWRWVLLATMQCCVVPSMPRKNSRK